MKYKLPESELTKSNCPNIRTHVKLGAEIWNLTGDTLKDTSDNWSSVFNEIGKIIQLLHTFDDNYHLTQIAGYEVFYIREPDIG